MEVKLEHVLSLLLFVCFVQIVMRNCSCRIEGIEEDQVADGRGCNYYLPSHPPKKITELNCCWDALPFLPWQKAKDTYREGSSCSEELCNFKYDNREQGEGGVLYGTCNNNHNN